MAEGVGFEPTEPVRVLLISSQVPLTTQPPFHSIINRLQHSIFSLCPATFEKLPNGSDHLKEIIDFIEVMKFDWVESGQAAILMSIHPK